MKSYNNVSMVLLKEEMRFCFPCREDLMHFEDEARKILSAKAGIYTRISDYPKKFFYVSLLHTSTEEIGELVELAHKIVNE